MAKKYTIEQLTDAVGNIDERYIAEARSEFDAVKVNSGSRGRNRFFNWKTLTAAAAVLVFVVAGTALVIRSGFGRAMQKGANQYENALAGTDEVSDEMTLSLYYWYTESGCRFAFLPAEIDSESNAFENGFFEDMALQNAMDIDDVRELMSDPERADYLRRNTVSVRSIKTLAGERKAYSYAEDKQVAVPASADNDSSGMVNEIREVREMLGIE